MEPLKHGCARCAIGRRSFLRLAGGTALSFLFPGMAARAATQRGVERPKSLITLWLSGGPSQLETWDPHPGKLGQASDFRLATRLKGVFVSPWFPRVADVLDRLTVIRSLTSKEGDHERASYYLKTGYRPDPTLRHPSLGAILTQQMPDPELEIPQHMTISPSNWPAHGGFLGDQFDAFKIFDPRDGLQNMQAPVEAERQKSRQESLRLVEKSFRARNPAGGDRTRHQETVDEAFAMMSSDQLGAFHLEDETKAVRERYGKSAFGQGCLLARRLVEVGVRAIEVTLDGFDSHVNNLETQKSRAEDLDPALAALILDLEERDLLQSTVVLVIGEFGRTPKINLAEGRDHWPQGFSALVGGGGLRRGIVIGETDPEGQKEMPSDPIQVENLFATVLSVVGVKHDRELMTRVGRPMKLCAGSPLARLRMS